MSTPYYLKCDIKKYFPSIDHAILKNLLRRVFKDERFLSLLDLVIDHPVPGNALGKGLPIGNLTSQYFANLYLGELDHMVKERLRIKGYIRYMDDFIFFHEDKRSLHGVLDTVRSFLSEELKLELKEKVTRIAPVSEGVPFLGLRIFRNLIRLQRANLVRLHRKVRKREQQYIEGLLTVEELCQSVGSMVTHARHANSQLLRRNLFERSLKLA